MPAPVSAGVAIANGQTVSGAINIPEHTLLGIETPGALTGTTMTFQVSRDGTTFVPLCKEDGNAYSITVAPSKGTHVNPDLFVGWPWLKVVSGSAEGGARTIGLTLRSLT